MLAGLAISVAVCVGKLVEADGDEVTVSLTKNEGEHPVEIVSGKTLSVQPVKTHLRSEAACALTSLIIRYRVRPVARRRQITPDDTALVGPSGRWAALVEWEGEEVWEWGENEGCVYLQDVYCGFVIDNVLFGECVESQRVSHHVQVMRHFT